MILAELPLLPQKHAASCCVLMYCSHCSLYASTSWKEPLPVCRPAAFSAIGVPEDGTRGRGQSSGKKDLDGLRGGEMPPPEAV